MTGCSQLTQGDWRCTLLANLAVVRNVLIRQRIFEVNQLQVFDVFGELHRLIARGAPGEHRKSIQRHLRAACGIGRGTSPQLLTRAVDRKPGKRATAGTRSAGHHACPCTGSSVQRSKESRQLRSGPKDQVISATMSVPDSARSMLPMA